MTNNKLKFGKYKNLIEFQMHFRTDEICLEHLKKLRFPDGIVCPDCKGRKFYMKSADMYCCTNSKCRKSFTLRTGTIFDRVRVPLRLAFAAVFLLNREPKIKESQLMKRLGISRSTAQSIMKRLKAEDAQKPIEFAQEEPEQEEKTLDQRWKAYQMWKKPVFKDPRRIT